MEEGRLESLRAQDGTALVVVLLAIVILLPPTLVLSTFALRWQRQAIDFRDTVAQEVVAEAGFEEARARLSAEGISMAPNESTSFELEDVDGIGASVRISRSDDVVVTLDGRILTGPAAGGVDLAETGVDAEGRVVYQYRKLAIYLVEVEVSRRPTLPAVRLEGVVARLPDGMLSTLGISHRRVYHAP